MEETTIFTVPELAKRFNIKQKTVYQWLRKYDLPVHRVGKFYFFKSTELEKWFDQFKVGSFSDDQVEV